MSRRFFLTVAGTFAISQLVSWAVARWWETVVWRGEPWQSVLNQWQGFAVAAAVVLVLALPPFRMLERAPVAMGLMAGGLASNALDLLRLGHVVDYLPFLNVAINGADLAITLGGMWLAAALLYQKRTRMGPF